MQGCEGALPKAQRRPISGGFPGKRAGQRCERRTCSDQTQEAIADALPLSLPADQHDEALDVAGDAISALYRSRFVIVLSAREGRRV